MTSDVKSTFDELMEDPEQKILFEKEYNYFLLNESLFEEAE